LLPKPAGKRKNPRAGKSGTWASKIVNPIELQTEAPVARLGRPTTTAATGSLQERAGVAKVRHLNKRLRRVEESVNQYLASKIGCVTSGDWIHGRGVELEYGKGWQDTVVEVLQPRKTWGFRMTMQVGR